MNNQIPGFVAAENAGLQDLDLGRSAGAANLIDNCIGNVEGMTVLLICEDPRHGWYDSAAPDRVHRELVARGATVRRMTVDLPENHPNAEVQAAMNDVDGWCSFRGLATRGGSTGIIPVRIA